MKRNLLIVITLFFSLGLNAQYWSQQNTNMAGTSTGVDQVSIVDSNIVWVNGFNGSGAGGYLPAHSRTQDGGATWAAGSYNGFGATVHSAVLTGVSYNKAFCVAYDTAATVASFWQTTDGGNTWTLVTGVMNSGPTTFADGVKFWDNGKGFCYGDPVSNEFDIYTTGDSGATWNDVPGANIPDPLSTSEYGYNGSFCATILPGGIGFFLTNLGRIFKTNDYGATWAVTTANPFTSMPSSGAVYASSENYIIVGNYILASGTWDWMYTTNGGAVWNAFVPVSGNFYQYQMCYVPGTANMFVATSPFAASIMGVAYSYDGGMNWTDYTDATYLQPFGTNIQCLGVAFYNPGLGWVGNYDQSGSFNTILKYHAPLAGIDAGVTSVIAPSNDTSCVLSTNENVTVSIINFGSDSLWNFDVAYQINSGPVVNETVTDTLLPFGILLHTFATTEDLSAFSTYVIKAYTTVTGDTNNANDTTIKTVISGDASITVNIQTDNFGSETTWDLINNTTLQVVASGGPYTNITGGAYYSSSVCVSSSDCFTFNIYDTFGDGMCCAYGNGSYELQWNGLSYGIIPGSFTTSAQITNICEPAPNDVGAFSIDISDGIPGSISPKGTVRNYGTQTQSFSATLTVNPGGYTSTQNITNLASGQTQQLTFSPDWNPTAGTYTVVLYTTLPGGDANTSNDTIVKSIDIIDVANKAYCYIAYDPSAALPVGPAILDLDNPGTIISLADQTGQNFVAGGAWANNHWYGTVYTDNNLIEIDTITGTRTVIGTLGVAIHGLTYDESTSTLFGTDGTSLYSINTSTGTATLIGSMGVSGSTFINLACNGITGIIYSVNIANDILYSIDKTTGAALSVGAIGFDASYAQGMEFHPNGTCYMAAYNVTSSSGELRTVNTSTGSTTLIGAFPGGAEIDALAIPCVFIPLPVDAGVISFSEPVSACVLSSSEDVTVTIMNFGTDSISNFEVAYTINNGTPVTDTITQTLNSLQTINYTFTGSDAADLSSPGIYSFKVYTIVTSDGNNANDTAFFSVNTGVASIPYSMGFEPTENYSGWVVEDANSDNYTWSISATGGNNGPYCVVYPSNATAADDWLITNCIAFETGKTYNISYWYKVYNASYPENFDVYIGNAPASASLTTQISNHDSLVNLTYLEGEADFTVPSTGNYYIGFHCNSAANMWNLYIDDINLTDITGIDETSTDAIINVFPNPAKNMLNISSSVKISQIKLMNAFGQLVFSNKINSNNTVISTVSLAEGVYYLQIETAAGFTSKKISVIK